MDTKPGLPDVEDLRSRLGCLELNGPHRRFMVNRMGGTGSSWLAKLLNTHPEVFCYHEGVIVRAYPASSYGTDDITSLIQWLAYDDMKGAYQAVGDVGSAWLGHIVSLPNKLFTTAMLLRHPARVLNTRLRVFPTDKSFTEISAKRLKHIQHTWGINALERNEIDQIFLQDLYILKLQIDAASSVNIVMQLERMTSDVDYCGDVLTKLTGRFYDHALIEPMLENPVNRRTQSGISIQSVLDGFTEQQRSWYRLILQDSISKVGYELDNELLVSHVPKPVPVPAGVQHSSQTRDQDMNVLRQMLIDKDRQIADKDRQIASLSNQVQELEHIWSAVQSSAGWRLMNLCRRGRERLLPAGTRARRVYDSVVRRFRDSMVVSP
jgi:hypothetical protein